MILLFLFFIVNSTLYSVRNHVSEFMWGCLTTPLGLKEEWVEFGSLHASPTLGARKKWCKLEFVLNYSLKSNVIIINPSSIKSIDEPILAICPDIKNKHITIAIIIFLLLLVIPWPLQFKQSSLLVSLLLLSLIIQLPHALNYFALAFIYFQPLLQHIFISSPHLSF